MEISQNFVAFSEYKNFTLTNIYLSYLDPRMQDFDQNSKYLREIVSLKRVKFWLSQKIFNVNNNPNIPDLFSI